MSETQFRCLPLDLREEDGESQHCQLGWSTIFAHNLVKRAFVEMNCELWWKTQNSEVWRGLRAKLSGEKPDLWTQHKKQSTEFVCFFLWRPQNTQIFCATRDVFFVLEKYSTIKWDFLTGKPHRKKNENPQRLPRGPAETRKLHPPSQNHKFTASCRFVQNKFIFLTSSLHRTIRMWNHSKEMQLWTFRSSNMPHRARFRPTCQHVWTLADGWDWLWTNSANVTFHVFVRAKSPTMPTWIWQNHLFQIFMHLFLTKNVWTPRPGLNQLTNCLANKRRWTFFHLQTAKQRSTLEH